ncbi:MAG: Fe(2+)-trafficking protein [Phycisphaerales bacterium]|nr:Fe(2+)-trafficking protein [Phycisphaerales bacterium]
MDANERIEQFKELCEQDPGNDMAHFSLGGAYAQAGRHPEAAEAYLKCIEANASFSKAYQLAGAAFIEAGDEARAGEVLEKGHAVASEQGDLMPQKGIAELLGKIGRPAPKSAPAAGEPSAPGGGFVCQRSGKPGTKLPRAPFRGAFGAWIQDNISKETFDEWIGLGTKIINELRLDLSRDPDDAVYDYGMRRFIGLTDEKYEALTGNKPPAAPAEYTELIDTILVRSGQVEDFGGEMHRQV